LKPTPTFLTALLLASLSFAGFASAPVSAQQRNGNGGHDSADEDRGSTELHVAINGDDSNSGTLAAPLRTIQRAADLAQPGDTVTVHEGIYRERLKSLAEGRCPYRCGKLSTRARDDQGNPDDPSPLNNEDEDRDTAVTFPIRRIPYQSVKKSHESL